MHRFLFAIALTACSQSSTPPAPDGGAKQIAAPTGDPLSWPLDAAGPYNVGHKIYTTTYSPPGGAPSRTIPIDVWYPTLDAEGENPKYKALFVDADVFEGASVAPRESYPVHVYSHGSSAFGGSASNMAHWFASHGWVYVAPNHVGNTLGDPEGKRPVSIHYLRSTDVSAALDAMEKLEAGDPLAGKLRTKRVLLSGHSFGAFTTWASGGVKLDTAAVQTKCDAGQFSAPCKAEEVAVFGGGLGDPRVVALIPMAGGMSDWVAEYATGKPTLLMSGSLDVSGQPMFDRSADITWLDFQDGCHELFALGGCPKFEEKLGWKLTGAWALAWGRRFVLGDASEKTTRVVTNAEPLSDKIVFKQKGALGAPAGDPR
jgi:hypothetical protein